MSTARTIFRGTDSNIYFPQELEKRLRIITEWQEAIFLDENLKKKYTNDFLSKNTIHEIQADFDNYEVSIGKEYWNMRQGRQIFDTARYKVNFKGDANLLKVRPTTFTLGNNDQVYPEGMSSFVYWIIAENISNEDVKSSFKEFESRFNKSSHYINESVREFNKNLEQRAHEIIQQTAVKILQRKDRESRL